VLEQAAALCSRQALSWPPRAARCQIINDHRIEAAACIPHRPGKRNGKLKQVHDPFRAAGKVEKAPDARASTRSALCVLSTAWSRTDDPSWIRLKAAADAVHYDPEFWRKSSACWVKIVSSASTSVSRCVDRQVPSLGNSMARDAWRRLAWHLAHPPRKPVSTSRNSLAHFSTALNIF